MSRQRVAFGGQYQGGGWDDALMGLIRVDGMLDGKVLMTTGGLGDFEAVDASDLISVGITVDGDFANFRIAAYRNTITTKGWLTLFGAEGTQESPAYFQDSSILGRLDFTGYTESGDCTGAQLLAQADGVWTDSSCPTDLHIHTVATGSRTLVNCAVFRSTGNTEIANDLLIGGVLHLTEGPRFEENDTTPSVGSGNVFRLSATGTQTITAFDNGHANHLLVLIAGGAGTTVQDNSNVRIGSDWVAAANDTLVLFSRNGTIWYRLAGPMTN
jgi:hypothetical protein